MSASTHSTPKLTILIPDNNLKISSKEVKHILEIFFEICRLSDE